MNLCDLTVIIPTYNRVEILKDCLHALEEQSLPKLKFEVIVGDDGSKDNTLEVLEKVSSSVSYSLRWFSQRNAGPSAVRNKAIKMALSPVVVFFNDDTIATPRLLEAHYELHKSYPQQHIAFLGKVTIDPSLPYSPFAKLHLDSSFAVWDSHVGSNGKVLLDWRVFYTCNLSLKKRFLEKHGLFDEDIPYGEDVELGARLDRYGLRIFYSPRALGYHRHFLTESEYLNIARKEGLGLATWFLKRPSDAKYLKALSFPFFLSKAKRFKYELGNVLFDRKLRPFWLKVARRVLDKYEPLGLEIYKKLYQAIKRETIYEFLRSRGN